MNFSYFFDQIFFDELQLLFQTNLFWLNSATFSVKSFFMNFSYFFEQIFFYELQLLFWTNHFRWTSATFSNKSFWSNLFRSKLFLTKTWTSSIGQSQSDCFRLNKIIFCLAETVRTIDDGLARLSVDGSGKASPKMLLFGSSSSSSTWNRKK